MADKEKKAEKKEKDASKLFLVCFVVGLIVLVVGFVVWLISSKTISLDSIAWGEEDDLPPGHTTELVNYDTTANQSTLYGVLFQDSVLFDCSQKQSTTIKERYGENAITEYTLVDMNGDGTKDLILHLVSDEAEEGISYVLLSTSQGVWGLEFVGRAMETIYVNGIFQGTQNPEETGYYRILTDEASITNKEIAYDRGWDFRIADEDQDGLKEVSRVEFITYINETCGTMIQNFRPYTEENLKNDLENPDAFDLAVELELGPDYWSALICELPQYNDDMGLSYEEFVGADEAFYSDDARWKEELESVFLCTDLEQVQAIGATESIYDAEYAALEDGKVFMLGATMENQEEFVSSFIVDAKNKVEPAVFAVPGKKQGEPERDALVWSCGDTYLIIFSPADSRETPFMDRQALAVCYVMKDHCGVTRYPIAVLPEMSAELE